ncbi:MAG: hypothetical protein IPM25_07285 [Chloracidobacterium sp.]|nr:hypothetical protein [Chloracidobacterium sp.]
MLRYFIGDAKYLYLTKREWADAWINGGEVPIRWASSYKSEEREGTQTPDENLNYDAPIDIANYGSLFRLHHSESITMIGCNYNGDPLPDMIGVKHVYEDGYLFCCSNRFDPEVAHKLRKEACVKIRDMGRLKCIIDYQLRIEGRMGQCEYTHDHRRNAFLKSHKDAWQDEYRIFWQVIKPVRELEQMEKPERMIRLPPGVATEFP